MLVCVAWSKLTLFLLHQHKVFLRLLQYLLLNEVCCSLVNKSTPPGQEDWNSADSVWTRIMNLAKDISLSDPQFLLKVTYAWRTTVIKQLVIIVDNPVICN